MKRILIVSLCVLMTLLGIACADNSNAKSDVASETISVPNVVGMNLDDAKEVIKESGLVIGNIEYIDNKENEMAVNKLKFDLLYFSRKYIIIRNAIVT